MRFDRTVKSVSFQMQICVITTGPIPERSWHEIGTAGGDQATLIGDKLVPLKPYTAKPGGERFGPDGRVAGFGTAGMLIYGCIAVINYWPGYQYKGENPGSKFSGQKCYLEMDSLMSSASSQTHDFPSESSVQFSSEGFSSFSSVNSSSSSSWSSPSDGHGHGVDGDSIESATSGNSSSSSSKSSSSSSSQSSSSSKSSASSSY